MRYPQLHQRPRRHGFAACLAVIAAFALAAGCNAITGLGDYQVYDSTGVGASGAGGSTTSTGGGASGAGGGTTTSGGGGSGGEPASCQNGTLDPGEEDIDCGGPCPPCSCTDHTDCWSEACINDLCAEIVQVATGSAHACAVLGDGTAHCWGQNDDGQLGDGTTVDHFNPEPVPGLSGVVGAALGRRSNNTTDPMNAFSCAWLDDGTVSCWGRNDYGQVGIGVAGASVLTPTVVPGLSNVEQVVAGRYHACARLTSQSVHCWGRNNHGQVGDGTNNDALSPVNVLTGAVELAAGLDFTCARMATGAAQCWGRNDDNQLGTGDGLDKLSPTSVPSLASLSEIAAGKQFACARSGADAVWCWGDNTDGQLATGNVVDQPQPASITSLSQIAQLALGIRIGYGSATGGHGCALHVDATVSCWGCNSNGQLGTGSVGVDEHLPVAVTSLSSVAELALGVDYSCARLTTGALRCWGRNNEGQLGTGSAGGNQAVPTPVVWP